MTRRPGREGRPTKPREARRARARQPPRQGLPLPTRRRRPSRVGRIRSRRLLRSGQRSPSPARQSLRPRCVSRPEPQEPRAPSELQEDRGPSPRRRRSRGFSSKNSRGPRRASRKLAAILNIPPELSSSRSSSSAKPPSASDRTSARARSRPSEEMTVAARWAKPTSSACSFSSPSALVSTATPAKLSSENVISSVV